jgi:hypothetical protein
MRRVFFDKKQMSWSDKMNDLQHTATAALAVLNRVQIGLERIRTGNGSAALLPTLADQLRDAVQIIEMISKKP